MALELVSKLRNLWPFWVFKFDDLRSSDELVRKLRIPERTKQFVYAVQDPETQSVIYILSAQSLSESSALDVECLIREVSPEAVIAQVAVSHGIEMLAEEERELEDYRANPLPTSSVEVLRRCFVDKVRKEKYEDLAGSLVLREIFGVSFHGHCLVAKKMAEETGSSFLVLESPCLKSLENKESSPQVESGSLNKFRTFVNSLIPQQAFGSVVASPRLTRRFLLTNDTHSRTVKLLSPYLEASSPVSESEIQTPEDCYEAPAFARSIYPLLSDLHAIFSDLPSIGRALAHAQKMLHDVSNGEAVGSRTMSEVCTFRVAVEGLRIALNTAGRLPIERTGKSPEFSELSVEEKSRVLFARTLRARAGKYKTTVVVVDAGSLAGLRKHWHDPVPFDVERLGGQEIIAGQNTDKKRLLTGKPVVAVGAGATAVIGVSSLSKTVPASFVKLVALKLPASAKLVLAQTHKALSLVLGKSLGPAKAGMVSAEKIRAVAHGVIASAEKTSLSAMRTAFYEIMRKRRRVAPIGALPWATFGCSVATCSGLLVYGDGIECAVESVPAAPSIASLGRGIERLREVSLRVSGTDMTRIHSSLESLMTRLKQVKRN